MPEAEAAFRAALVLAEADASATTPRAVADTLCGAACVYAQAAAVLDQVAAGRAAVRAFELLRRAVACGCRNLIHLLTDEVLAEQGGRLPDQLVQALRAANKSVTEEK